MKWVTKSAPEDIQGPMMVVIGKTYYPVETARQIRMELVHVLGCDICGSKRSKLVEVVEGRKSKLVCVLCKEGL